MMWKVFAALLVGGIPISEGIRVLSPDPAPPVAASLEIDSEQMIDSDQFEELDATKV